MVKACTQCGIRMGLSKFYRNSRGPLGRDWWCKKCRALAPYYSAEYRSTEEFKRSARITGRKSYASHREQNRAKNRAKWKMKSKLGLLNHRDPYKRRAGEALRVAVRLGKIVKPKSCSECGWVGVLHGHHHKGYDHPLEVSWLCSICHGKKHRKP